MRPITKNDYNVWREDPVTMQFLSEVFEKLEDEKARFIIGTPDEILKITYARNEAMTLLTEVLEWQPQELINQEES